MRRVFLLAACFVFCACGKKNDDDTASGTTFAEIVVESSTSAESKTYTYTTLNACTFSADTGLFNSSFGGLGGAALSVKIKGFAKTDATYTCAQATDNRTYPSVGSYYNGCSVDVSIPNSVNTATYNTYSMYRKDETVKSFTYPGTCSVNVTFTNPSTVRGVISCADMVQTHLESSIKNPISTDVKASVGGTSYFTCNL